MKSVIEDLFVGELNRIERGEKKRVIPEEVIKAYEELSATLSAQQQELFEEYIDQSSVQQGQDEEEMYRSGVKTALLLVFEVLSSD